MIYLVSVSSNNILEYSDYLKIIEDIESQITTKDKVIIVTSSKNNYSENKLESILKENINTPKTIVDTMLSLNEIESACYLSLYLNKNKKTNKLLMPHQIPIVCDKTVEYIEMNNIIYTLTKCQYLIIPGNYGITRCLDYIMYNNDSPESLIVYLYNELLKRKYKTKVHLYKPIEQLNFVDGLNYSTNEKVHNINYLEIDNYKNALERYISIDVINNIKLNKLKLTIGNRFLKGTTIIGN